VYTSPGGDRRGDPLATQPLIERAGVMKQRSPPMGDGRELDSGVAASLLQR
jgi:hypothetical protein